MSKVAQHFLRCLEEHEEAEQDTSSGVVIQASVFTHASSPEETLNRREARIRKRSQSQDLPYVRMNLRTDWRAPHASYHRHHHHCRSRAPLVDRKQVYPNAATDQNDSEWCGCRGLGPVDCESLRAVCASSAIPCWTVTQRDIRAEIFVQSTHNKHPWQSSAQRKSREKHAFVRRRRRP